MSRDLQPGSFRAWSEEVHPDSRADFEDDERDTRDTDSAEPPFKCEYCGVYCDELVELNDTRLDAVGYNEAAMDVCDRCFALHRGKP